MNVVIVLFPSGFCSGVGRIFSISGSVRGKSIRPDSERRGAKLFRRHVEVLLGGKDVVIRLLLSVPLGGATGLAPTGQNSPKKKQIPVRFSSGRCSYPMTARIASIRNGPINRKQVGGIKK